MATMQDVVRRITIQAQSSGVDQTSASLQKLAAAQNGVAVASENTDKATLSLQSRLNSLQKSLDAEYAAEQKLASIEKTLDAARAQGLISLTRENELLDLASTKYKVAGESAEAMAEGFKTAKEVATGLVAGLGVSSLLVGLGELPSKIEEAVKAGAELKDTAETIGTTTTNLQELDYAAQQNGVSTETMNTALEKFSTNLGKAQQGSGELYDILKANHVQITGNLLKDFENYANLVEGATSAEQKNLLVTAAFGRNAQELGSVFNDGAKGVSNLADEAQKAGVVLGDETLTSAKELNDEFVKMQAQLGTTFEQFMITVAPALEVVLGGITTAVQGVNAAIAAGEQALPIAQQSEAALERNIAQQKALLAQSSSTGALIVQPGQRNYGTAHPDNSARAALEAQIVAEQGELSNRAGSAIGQWAGSNDNGGWGTRPAPTVTPNPTAMTAAASAAKTAANQYRELIASAQDATTALNAQAAAVGLNTFDAAKLTEQQKLLNDANKDGLQLSPAQLKAIDDEATAYAAAEQKLQTITTTYNTLEGASQDFTSTMVGDLQQGKDAWSSFADGVKSASNDILNEVVKLETDSLFNSIWGSGGLSGLVSGASSLLNPSTPLVGIPNAKGGVYGSSDLSAYRNMVVAQPTYFRFAQGGVFGEAGPEAIMPLTRGPDGNLGVRAANQNVQVNFRVINNASDAVTVSARQASNGNLEVYIDKVGAKKLATPGTDLNRANRIAMGGRQQLVRR